MVGIIYVAKNRINGKLYVGQTVCDLKVRVRGHDARVRQGSTSAFHCAIRKYGIESFSFEAIAHASSRDELVAKEIYWIGKLHSESPSGYNLTPGGERVIFTDDVRRKISLASRSAKRPRSAWSEESKRKQAEGVSVALKGKPKSQAHRAALSLAHKGQPVSAERRQLVSLRHKGRVKSGSERANISAAATARWEKWRAERGAECTKS